MTICVVSTGLNAPTKRLCLASVRAQTEPHEHVYVESDPGVTVAENLYMAIGRRASDDVIVWLDGDDWLAHPEVLTRVREMHEAGALLTYGQYMTIDGKPGHCAPYVHNSYRREPWLASHLKTFRAGLFHQIHPEDLQLDGEWLSLAVDVGVTLPMLELAGPERVKFCEEVLCVYNSGSSFEASASLEMRAKEKETEMRIRAKERKYEHA